jgi:RNA polymerase subunit RPABC4/transcription elongation factor Spt4
MPPCPACHTSAPRGSRTCPECGYDLAKARQETPPGREATDPRQTLRDASWARRQKPAAVVETEAIKAAETLCTFCQATIPAGSETCWNCGATWATLVPESEAIPERAALQPSLETSNEKVDPLEVVEKAIPGLTKIDGGWQLQPLGSETETWLKVTRSISLESGDIIQIGGKHYRFDP